MQSFPFFRQLDAKDCGPACLRMISKSFGKNFSIQTLRERSHISRQGVSLVGISEAAESIGFRSIGVRLTWPQLLENASLPCIAHWEQRHFIVIYKVTKRKVFVADPAVGKVSYTREEFLKGWLSTKRDGEDEGLCLLLDPTPGFYEQEGEKKDRASFSFLFSYLKPHKKLLIQLVIGMLVGSLLMLILPFLTQAIVDIGIGNQDLKFVYLVILAQFVLIIGKTSIEFIRSWLLLHISTRVNVTLISDYLIKLMRLPVSFFETRLTGDILQRIGDHSRIESFLTNSSLSILFSMFNLLVFGIVLAIYNGLILLIFVLGSILYFIWILVFLKRRRELDHKRFSQLSKNQNSIIQLVAGMQEIKLNNSEKTKRWEWEGIQARLFRVRVKSLTLTQYQRIGSVLINDTKNILISFIAAKAVIESNMTLGVMFAVQYIIGFMNAPIEQLIGFIHSAQDAKISLERLAEVHEHSDEQKSSDIMASDLPLDHSFYIRDLVFQYEGPQSKKVLDKISLTIPENKVTAIVGSSGSGKTTLIKLLLGFYSPVEGEIRIGDSPVRNIDQNVYRAHCGVVIQDGYIFSDTIARNIALGDDEIDKAQLALAARIANIGEFVGLMPLGFNTKIGGEGQGLSQGQKQRILIARAVYKNPDILFFDEATNALDANNERLIMNHLNEYYRGKTVIVVAHRLSTVKKADQIVVLEKGCIVETGNHEELTMKQGVYFELVKNQLELGS
ncbi:MAG: peptidase domain-containing ABC transporter [Bacteroidota bacterium]|nr:peptidase domain-containing ABC transporter [Bacteroidota bacterium]